MAGTPAGLTEAEALVRLAAGQENTTNLKPLRTLSQARRESIFTIFNLNVIGLALILALLSEWIGAGIAVLLFGFTTAIRNFAQWRAAKRIDAVRDNDPSRSTVIRDGRPRTVDSNQIVPGDLVVISAGDQVPVDGVVTGSGSMLIDSAMVTGSRGWERVQSGDEVLAGSVCLSGRGRCLAQRVGSDRLIHARLHQRTVLASRRTPLERLVARILGGLFVIVTVYALILLAKFFRLDVGESGAAFVDAAPVIFSLVPTGLYLMIVIAYATGTADLARMGAVVQSARSVELLAESTVICFTDLELLSGTDMRVVPIPPPGGRGLAEAIKHDDWPSAADLHRTLGDFARSSSQSGPLADILIRSFDGEPRATSVEEPHLATLGWTAMAFDDADDPFLYVLALPGRFGLTGAGDETLVLARGPADSPTRDADGQPHLPAGLVPVCLVEHHRTLSPDALETVRGFMASGVRIKVFSPSPPEEAITNLREAGLSEADERTLLPGGGLSRAQLETLSRPQQILAVREHRLFGGLTPEQMGDLVAMLRDAGDRVTVVGDGLTDLPAMQEAHLSVAQPGSAKAAAGLADIILLGESASVLLTVLHRGQAIVRGLLDVMKLNLSLVLCTALLIVMVRLFGVGFPYVAGQGSVITALAVTVPSLLLPLWARPAPVSSERYLPILGRFVLPAGILLSLVAFGVYFVFVSRAGDVVVAQLAVTHTLLYAGLGLSIMIQPPLLSRSSLPAGAGTPARPDWRTTVLAAALAVVGTLAPVIPIVRRQFRIDLLPGLTDYGIVLLAVAVWAGALHLVWRLFPRVD